MQFNGINYFPKKQVNKWLWSIWHPETFEYEKKYQNFLKPSMVREKKNHYKHLS